MPQEPVYAAFRMLGAGAAGHLPLRGTSTSRTRLTDGGPSIPRRQVISFGALGSEDSFSASVLRRRLLGNSDANTARRASSFSRSLLERFSCIFFCWFVHAVGRDNEQLGRVLARDWQAKEPSSCRPRTGRSVRAGWRLRSCGLCTSHRAFALAIKRALIGMASTAPLRRMSSTSRCEELLDNAPGRPSIAARCPLCNGIGQGGDRRLLVCRSVDLAASEQRPQAQGLPARA